MLSLHTSLSIILGGMAPFGSVALIQVPSRPLVLSTLPATVIEHPLLLPALTLCIIPSPDITYRSGRNTQTVFNASPMHTSFESTVLVFPIPFRSAICSVVNAVVISLISFP